MLINGQKCRWQLDANVTENLIKKRAGEQIQLVRQKQSQKQARQRQYIWGTDKAWYEQILGTERYFTLSVCGESPYILHGDEVVMWNRCVCVINQYSEDREQCAADMFEEHCKLWDVESWVWAGADVK